MKAVLDDYIRSYSPASWAFTKRSDAADLATALAAEFNLNTKAIIVDKDGKSYRVFCPLVSAYWAPHGNSHAQWQEEFDNWHRAIKKAMVADG